MVLKARVKDGRLVLDEPTDLPEGAEVEVAVLGDDLSPEERAELHASLDRALADSDAGRGVDAVTYLAEYRARRAADPAR
ncbi:MAG: hypothetical protein ABI467_07165 [Kofleriaceae bacterium]